MMERWLLSETLKASREAKQQAGANQRWFFIYAEFATVERK